MKHHIPYFSIWLRFLNLFCVYAVDPSKVKSDEAFSQKYDFFAAVFEYLIKDYNKDFGKYAEYYTPHSIASIIARVLVPGEVQNVNIYDPAAGSGTLVLALAHEIGEENCTIYTQDISQKSNESYIFSPYGLFHGPQV